MQLDGSISVNGTGALLAAPPQAHVAAVAPQQLQFQGTCPPPSEQWLDVIDGQPLTRLLRVDRPDDRLVGSISCDRSPCTWPCPAALVSLKNSSFFGL